jgi:hypothetical protein
MGAMPRVPAFQEVSGICDTRFMAKRPRDPAQLAKQVFEIHSLYCNYARIHKSLRVMPSMAAGLCDHVWTLEEVVTMADSYMPKPAKRGPYKKRESAA